jgi:hypothetical protein
MAVDERNESPPFEDEKFDTEKGQIEKVDLDGIPDPDAGLSEEERAAIVRCEVRRGQRLFYSDFAIGQKACSKA